MTRSSRLPSPRLAAVVLAAVLSLPAARAQAATPPAIRARQAQARAVIAQIDAIDRQLGRAVEQWDGARYRLGLVQARLAQTRTVLALARRQQRVARRRLVARAVQLYTGEAPSSLDVIVGAANLSAAIDAADGAALLAAQDRALVAQIDAARRQLGRAERALARDRARRAATVAALAHRRAQIEAQLARRQRLLASVRSEIRVLKKREAERQRELAAAARARLARREAALRAARVAAEQRAQTAAPLQGQALEQTTTDEAPTPTATDTTAIPPPSTAATPASAGAGHPEAASIALRYLGVPYVWGGASPAGFDCSGLVMYVYAQLGIQLPHYAAAQYGYGTPVARDQLQPGDLVFFDGLGHVGIYIGNGEMVHAPHTGDVVKISPLSEFGGAYVGARRL